MAGRGLNKVMIIGNLGKDPEMKYTPSGKPITTFSVAVGRMSRDPATGERAPVCPDLAKVEIVEVAGGAPGTLA